MKLALHFDSKHADLAGDYRAAVYQLVFSVLLARWDSRLDSRVFSGDLLFDHILDRKAPDVVGDWFFPRGSVWAKPNGVEWNLPPHMAIYAVCLENADQKAADRIHKGLAGSNSYLGAMEVGDSPVHRKLWSMLASGFRVVGRSAQVFWDGNLEDDKDEAVFKLLQTIGFDSVSWGK